MLDMYLRAALRTASIEPAPGGDGWYEVVAALPHVSAHAGEPEEVSNEFADELQGYIVALLQQGQAVPVLEGIELLAEDLELVEDTSAAE